MIICLKPCQLTVNNYQQACSHIPISIIECMMLFGYTDNQGILLGDGEPWGSSFQGPGLPDGVLCPQILGIQLKVHSPAQDEVLLSRWSLFCLFPPSLILELAVKLGIHIFLNIKCVCEVLDYNHNSLLLLSFQFLISSLSPSLPLLKGNTNNTTLI